MTPGTKLGPYEVIAAIGAGGMGEVYRARDSKLGRDVAIKVLPTAFARDTERMARFQREAKVLASLDHPNIASIYGLEDSGGTRALVMQLVEGPTLADRIKQGPIPLDEALKIAKQICEALEYAHERGIVHRDLKPANVKLTNDDAVKVLDFGLAKAIEGDPSSIDISSSPTMSHMATMQGVLLGTAAYMAPEQAKGKSVDRRADIWAFGCVVYEMLTGKMAFQGETVTDTLAAVIMKEPDWSLLPPATPARVRVLLQRCLQKDPRQRLRDIGDARISLDEVLSGAPEISSAGDTPLSVPMWRRALPWGVAVLLFATLAPIVFIHLREKTPSPAEPVRFEIPVPERTILAPQCSFSVSPDGRLLAFFAAGSDGAYRLWVRPLNSLEARPLPGSESTDTAVFFWSPDSRYIAFDAGGVLKKIGVSGGAAETLYDLPTNVGAVGGSWNRDGTIIFGQSPGVIMRVSAAGGAASPLTTLDLSRHEIYHDFPSFLPDGRHFIYLRHADNPENSGVYVGSLDAKPEEQDSKRLVSTDWGPAYVPSSDGGGGYLLFVNDGTLMAQTFDDHGLQLVGEPVSVIEHVGSFRTFGFFSVSRNGVLAYRTSGSLSQLTWFDQQGRVLGTVGEPGNISELSLSPDGTQAVVNRLDPSSGKLALWLVDLSRGTSTRFTFGPWSTALGAWSPEGNRLIFASYRGAYDLYQKLATGVKDEELLLKSTEDKIPASWSGDGRFLLYDSSDSKDSKARTSLWVLPLEGDKKPFPFLRTEFNNSNGQFSPDERWVAYVSDESGRDEVYVRTFSPNATEASSDMGGKWLVSTGGGTDLPKWRRDGKEMYYLAPDEKLMAVEIATNPGFRAGAPKVLFQAPQTPLVNSYSWGVTPDGKRFLFAAPAQQGAAPFSVVLNWQAALRK